MKTFTKIIFGLVIAATLGSCASTYIRSGKEAYNDLMFQEAINNLDKGLAKKQDLEGLKYLADSYMRINNFDKATETYLQLSKESGVSNTDRLDFSHALLSMGKYDEARNELLKIKSNPLASKLLESLDEMDALTKDSTLVDVKMLNIGGLDMVYSPVITSKGLVVSGEKSIKSVKDPYTNLSYVDMYEVEKSGAGWGTPKKLSGQVNAKYHDGIPAFSTDGKSMIFSRSNYIAKNKLGKDIVNVNNIQLYEATKENATDTLWGEPKLMKLSDEQFMYCHPALSPDGNELYFSSDQPKGFGGMDLYKVVKKENGKWDKPVNLGSSINTLGDEVFPTVKGNDTLYFSSDSHLTIGGLDINYAVDKGTGFGSVTNVGAPINSSFDDLGIVYSDRENGYFSSDRSGADRIYSFELLNPEIRVDGLLVDEKSGLSLADTKITIMNLTDGTEEVIYSDKDGKFSYDLLPGKKYRMVTDNEAYFSKSIDISTDGIVEDTVFNETYKLKLLVVTPEDDGTIVQNDDGTYQIHNIYWDYNKWDIRADGEPYLMDLVKLFNDNQNLNIEIQSHCDCRGGNAYNKNLSKKRAKAVVDYLVVKGIPRKMLKSKGYGETRPKSKCPVCESCSEEEHQQNRRTEFVVRDKK